MTGQTRYRMKYRPPGFATLPGGLGWQWAELPPDHPRPEAFPHLKRSDWRFGVFTTDRPITFEEATAYEIEEAP